jgi:arsenate reductase
MVVTYALLPQISEYIGNMKNQFTKIPMIRKKKLKKISQFVSDKIEKGHPANLLFICTHNSRRSHMSQIWAQTAAIYYQLPMVTCFSGGMEATALNPRVVKSMSKVGFEITRLSSGKNPIYEVTYARDTKPIRAYSKKYDDKLNPSKNFCAVMTCADADEKCPVIFGAADRVSIPYEDPKEADDTEFEEAQYDERNHQIGLEMIYIFSQVHR